MFGMKKIEARFGTVESALKSIVGSMQAMTTSIDAATKRDDQRKREIEALHGVLESHQGRSDRFYHEQSERIEQLVEITTIQTAEITKLRELTRPSRYTLNDLVEALTDVALQKSSPPWSDAPEIIERAKAELLGLNDANFKGAGPFGITGLGPSNFTTAEGVDRNIKQAPSAAADGSGEAAAPVEVSPDLGAAAEPKDKAVETTGYAVVEEPAPIIDEERDFILHNRHGMPKSEAIAERFTALGYQWSEGLRQWVKPAKEAGQ